MQSLLQRRCVRVTAPQSDWWCQSGPLLSFSLCVYIYILFLLMFFLFFFLKTLPLVWEMEEADYGTIYGSHRDVSGMVDRNPSRKVTPGDWLVCSLCRRWSCCRFVSFRFVWGLGPLGMVGYGTVWYGSVQPRVRWLCCNELFYPVFQSMTPPWEIDVLSVSSFTVDDVSLLPTILGAVLAPKPQTRDCVFFCTSGSGRDEPDPG